MKKSKSGLKSKTVWVNVLAIIGVVFASEYFQELVTPERAVVYLGLVNILLRWITKGPVHFIPRKSRPKIAALFLVPWLALVLGGCSTYPKQLVMLGDTLAATGHTFVDTGEMYDSLYDEGKITKEEYRDWADFATHFKAVYAGVQEVWVGLSNHPEIESPLEVEKMLGIMTELAERLYAFYRAGFVAREK